MSGTRKRDYQAVYEEILKLLPTCSKLENIVLDFKAAQWQAIKTVLPEVHIQGCEKLCIPLCTGRAPSDPDSWFEHSL